MKVELTSASTYLKTEDERNTWLKLCFPEQLVQQSALIYGVILLLVLEVTAFKN